MNRKYNFSPGPATMPEAVLKRIADEFVCYPDIGCSIVEHSHRSPLFLNIIEKSKTRLLELLNLSNDYSVIFLQGGATTEFFRIPMNLLGPGKRANYIDTGVWTHKAINEAKYFGEVVLAGNTKKIGYKEIPLQEELNINPEGEYVYLCSNNTIYGTQYRKYPETELPLIGDFTSDILCREIDLNQFGIIFAGAQKNLGISGLSVILIRNDILQKCNKNLPSMCSYPLQVTKNSTLNTSPVFAIYFTHYVLEWLAEQGGVKAIEKLNREKSSMVYNVIDKHSIYTPYCNPRDRSIMNITFTLPDEEKTNDFLKGAEAEGLINLKGHRSLGGIRASMYNAFPLEGAQKLVKYLEAFVKKY